MKDSTLGESVEEYLTNSSRCHREPKKDDERRVEEKEQCDQ